MSFDPQSDRMARANREKKERGRLARAGGPPATPVLDALLGKTAPVNFMFGLGGMTGPQGSPRPELIGPLAAVGYPLLALR